MLDKIARTLDVGSVDRVLLDIMRSGALIQTWAICRKLKMSQDDYFALLKNDPELRVYVREARREWNGTVRQRRALAKISDLMQREIPVYLGENEFRHATGEAELCIRELLIQRPELRRYIRRYNIRVQAWRDRKLPTASFVQRACF